jgi:hypothetical protein
MVARSFLWGPSLWGHVWSAPVLCTPAESTHDYGDWTGSSLVAYRTTTCYMGSVLIE